MNDDRCLAPKHVEVRVVPSKATRSWRVLVRSTSPVLDQQDQYRWKYQALRAAVKLAKAMRAELFIAGRDGKIKDRRSYGNDPKGRG